MLTLALIASTALDGLTDALLWPRFRRWNFRPWHYQAVRAVLLRLPMLVGVYLLSGALGVLLCLVMVWAAPQDSLYHAFGAEGHRGDGRFGIPVDGVDHDHKGPILPALASDALGIPFMSEGEYRTASVAAGLAVLACAVCVDVLTIAGVL